ncbi:MAG: DUF6429 family protein [Bacteroidota bacterium]
MGHETELQQRIEDLTLLLAYLTSSDEGHFGSARKTRKGLPLEALNHLQQEGLVEQMSKTKSLYITEKGVDKAKLLASELLGKDF